MPYPEPNHQAAPGKQPRPGRSPSPRTTKHLRMQPLLFWLALFAVIVMTITGPAGRAWAKTRAMDAAKQPSVVQEIKHLVAEDVKSLDKAHDQLSQGIAHTAAWFDSFFDDRRHRTETNATRLRLKFITLFEKGSRPTLDVQPDLKLVLPHFNRKFSLVLSGNPDNNTDADASPTQVLREEFAETNQRNVAAALQYHVFMTKRQSLILIGGLRFRPSGSVALFTGPRYRVYFPFEPWALRFTQRAYGFSDIGWELISTVDVERVISPTLFFRSTTEGTLFSNDKGYYYDQSFQLFQSISDRRMIVYEWNSYLVTNKPGQLRETNFRLRYRQRLWRDWIVVEVAPQIAFPEDNDFKLTPGIIFRLELSFGTAFTSLKETGK